MEHLPIENMILHTLAYYMTERLPNGEKFDYSNVIIRSC